MRVELIQPDLVGPAAVGNWQAETQAARSGQPPRSMQAHALHSWSRLGWAGLSKRPAAGNAPRALPWGRS